MQKGHKHGFWLVLQYCSTAVVNLPTKIWVGDRRQGPWLHGCMAGDAVWPSNATAARVSCGQLVLVPQRRPWAVRTGGDGHILWSLFVDANQEWRWVDMACTAWD